MLLRPGIFLALLGSYHIKGPLEKEGPSLAARKLPTVGEPPRHTQT